MPNCAARGDFWLVDNPNKPLDRSDIGLFRFTRFSTLNISLRISKPIFSTFSIAANQLFDVATIRPIDTDAGNFARKRRPRWLESSVPTVSLTSTIFIGGPRSAQLALKLLF